MGCEHYVTAVYAIPISMSDIVAEFQEHCPRGKDGKRFTIVVKEPFKDIEEDLNEVANVCFSDIRRVYLKDIFQLHINDDGDIRIDIGNYPFTIMYKKGTYDDNKYEVYSDFEEGLYITIPLGCGSLEQALEKFKKLSETIKITGELKKYVEVLYG